MPKRLKQTRTRQGEAAVPSRGANNDKAQQFLARTMDQPEQEHNSFSLISEYMSKIGKRGGRESGKRRMQNLSPEKRSLIAHKAAVARWERVKKERENPQN